MFRFPLVQHCHVNLSNWRLTFISGGIKTVIIREAIMSAQTEPLDARLQNLVYGLQESEANYSKSRSEFNVQIGLTIYPSKMSGDFIRIWGTEEKNVLTNLRDAVCRRGLKFMVKVEVNMSSEHTPVLQTGEVDLETLASPKRGAELAELLHTGIWNMDFWDHTRARSDVHASVSISCIVSREHASFGDLLDSLPLTGTKMSIAQKLLDEGLNSDATIVGSDEVEVQAHKFVLTDQSEVLKMILNNASKSKESITGIIRMNDMSSKSLKSFLAFLYLEDIEDPKEDCAVALDLLEAAHFYDIPRLWERMKMILLTKPDKWFNLEVGVQLYFFSKNLEDGSSLNQKAISVLKLNYSVLKESPFYTQLFNEEVEFQMFDFYAILLPSYCH